MTIESVHCAICGQYVALNENHVEIEGERTRTESPNEQDSFVLHDGCWDRLFDGWMEPA